MKEKVKGAWGLGAILISFLLFFRIYLFSEPACRHHCERRRKPDLVQSDSLISCR